MKLINETLYSITIENVQNEKNKFFIDLSDPIQANALGQLFVKYDGLGTVSDLEADDPKEMMKELQKLSDWQHEVNELFDVAFGKGANEKIFAGNHSLITQGRVISFLEKEVEKAGIKIEDYVKSIRKDMLVNDHKPKDTI